MINLKQKNTHKVIAVFDVPDDYDVQINRLSAKLIANGYTIECLSITDDIKLIPQKKEVDYSKCLNYQDGFYAEGWNDCLDEIIGE